VFVQKQGWEVDEFRKVKPPSQRMNIFAEALRIDNKMVGKQFGTAVSQIHEIVDHPHEQIQYNLLVERWEHQLGVHGDEGCKLFGTPTKGFAQQGCCMLAGTWHCLPSLIVAGTQKSGTTALAAYLVKDEMVNFATSKELHFFDRNKTLHKYLTYFEPLRETEISTKISVEITPSYISFPGICEKIRDTVPEAGIVLMLREPVQRAYSEVQMKQRRVDMQEDFRRKLKANTTFIFDCLGQIVKDQGPVSEGGVKTCVPPALKEHGKYMKFQTEMLSGAMGKRTKTVSKPAPPPNNSPVETLNQFLGRCFNTGIHTDDGILQKMGGRDRNRDMEVVSSPDCFKKSLSEKVGDVNDELLGEASVLQECVDKHLPSMSGSQFPRSQAILECVPEVKGGISFQFIYRSLYGAQILACSQYISLDRILLIENDDLRNNPVEAVQRLHTHAGLPAHHVEAMSTAEIQSTLDLKFPSFEKVSGWKLDSEYMEISQRTKAVLAAFFSPFNEELFEMTGTKYAKWKLGP
jgi:hypothetical protein